MKLKVEKLAVLAVASLAITIFSDNRADVDLWGNVGFVKAWPSSETFLRTNTFSFTDPSHPWINHEWLSQYLLHKIWKTFGNAGLLGWKVTMGLAMLSLWHLAMQRKGISGPVTFILLCLIISTAGYGFSTRPHLWTYLFLTIFLFLLDMYDSVPLVLFLVFPAVGWLWTNLHGAFFIGLTVLMLFVLCQAVRLICSANVPSDARLRFLALFSATIAFGLLTLATPYGIDLWKFIADSFGKPRPFLSEWAPFTLVSHLGEHTDFLVLSVIAIAAICLRPLETSFPMILITGLAFISAFALRRQIPIFAIACVFSVPQSVDKLTREPLNSLLRRLPRASLAAFFVAIAIFSGAHAFKRRTNPLQIEVPSDRFPSEIVAFMRERGISGNVLAFFDWAEQVIWHCYPSCRVFLDGRFSDAYSDRVIDDYFAFLSGKDGWKSTLSKYSVDLLLLHNDLPLVPAIMRDPDWIVVASNSYATLFVQFSRASVFQRSYLKTDVYSPNILRKQAQFFP